MSLELHDISLSVNKLNHLSNISLSLEPGNFNVLLGRTLAGKTSVMRVIAGLEKPSQGKVLLHGRDVTTQSVQSRNVSMVYQQFINYPHMSVFDNIASPLLIAKVTPKEIKRRVEEVAQLLHISSFLQRTPLELSGGQQQRCAMARALVKDAQVVLFDEPLVNLDYKLRETLRLELKRIFRERDSIAVYATTEAHEALALGGTTALLHEGTLLQSGPALSLFHRPINLHAADLFHEPPLNRLVVDASDAQFSSVVQSLGDDNLSSCILAIRPDHVELSATTDDAIRLSVVIDLVEYSASETYLHVSFLHNNNTVNWVLHLSGIRDFAIHATLTIYVPGNKIYCFSETGETILHPRLTLDTELQ